MRREAAAGIEVLGHVRVPRIEHPVPVLLGVLDGAVVLGAVHGAVKRDDHPLGEDGVDCPVVEVCPVVSFQEQGWPVFLEEPFQVPGHLLTGRQFPGKGFKLVARA